MSELRSRAEKFLRRPNPFGRRAGHSFDEILARYVAGGPWDEGALALLQEIGKILELAKDLEPGFGGERDEYHREMYEILGSIHAEMSAMPPDAGQTMQGAESPLWKSLMPPENPPQYTDRPLTEQELRLLSYLRSALEGEMVERMRQFDECYMASDQGAVPWDTQLGQAIHDFASELEYFEPNEEWRKQASTLYGPDELRSMIRAVLALGPPTEDLADPST